MDSGLWTVMGRARRPLRALLATAFLVSSALAKPPIPTPADVPVVGEVDAYLLSTLYRLPDTDAGLDAVVEDEAFQALVEKHDRHPLCNHRCWSSGNSDIPPRRVKFAPVSPGLICGL